MSRHTVRSARTSDAVFIGWQVTQLGSPLALYNITAPNHVLTGSTVSENTLRRLHLRIPRVPQLPPRRRGTDDSGR
jgi:hypothetical protein